MFIHLRLDISPPFGYSWSNSVFSSILALPNHMDGLRAFQCEHQLFPSSSVFIPSDFHASVPQIPTLVPTARISPSLNTYHHQSLKLLKNCFHKNHCWYLSSCLLFFFECLQLVGSIISSLVGGRSSHDQGNCEVTGREQMG